ncbi:protein-glutamine gamma-glutamyltransferase 2-like [Amblyraja radiata]|uniref:protein-glutamine gamma-glutamyltransferase 2-like n=1 Tax=Amblyraja radiata TaxID=386614 RepID=UPI0014025CCB|nr:protein-glutamine gamma-glutamyltransferase 2-like [Amblyraja radiata]
MSLSADFHCGKNNQEHRTDEITSRKLIVRRGQPFQIALQLYSDEHIIDHNNIVFTVETGPKPSEASGSKVLFKLSSINPKQWSGQVVSSTGTRLVLSLYSPANAKIGRYNLSVLSPSGYQYTLFSLGEFILLFNPWCPEDEVFLNSEEQRQEYVMNEDGILYNGESRQIEGRPWFFGQFEEEVVDICLQILDKNLKFLQNPAKDVICRNDPVYISRVVTAMVNCADDKGVLSGKWSQPYSGGEYPWTWNGSVPILQKWYKGRCQPVRYGQCWVFAAVACTVLRCLGIPARVVTNFNSAHDSNGNLILDQEIDESGRPCGGESVWNFHVWLEGWMARNDLKSGYDGWQVLDPTPQEKSQGIYCCGPAPVKAIKEGAVEMKYDVPFIFAEVNADIVTWICSRDGTKKKAAVKTKHVGQFISTKRCGSNDREDITNEYKFPEGSQRERQIFNEAQMRNNLELPQEEKLQVQMEGDDSISHGSDIRAQVNITNNSSQSMVCKLQLNAQILQYTGSPEKQILALCVDEVTVQANDVATVPFNVPFSEFGHDLKNHRMIKMIAVAIDKRSSENALAMKDITVTNPQVVVKVLGEPILNRELNAEISFLNPLSVTLYNCIFTIEGLGLIAGWERIRQEEIKPNHVFAINIRFTPTKAGLRKLSVDFDCNRMMDVKGFQNIHVQNI